jgi:hypothetical protein
LRSRQQNANGNTQPDPNCYSHSDIPKGSAQCAANGRTNADPQTKIAG